MMPPSTGTRVSEGLQAQINSLGERMDKGFSELREMIQGFDARVRLVENREASCQPLTAARLDAAWKQIDANTVDIKALKETVAELRHANKILTWIGGLLGSSLLIWLVSQIMGLIK